MCISDSGIIALEGMCFEGIRIGCLDFEQERGNRIVVDFRCRMDLRVPAETDDLGDTLDYAGIYSIVAETLQEPCRLLEHACGRIVRAVAAAHPELDSFSVTVSKENPPVEGLARWARVTLDFQR